MQCTSGKDCLYGKWIFKNFFLKIYKSQTDSIHIYTTKCVHKKKQRCPAVAFMGISKEYCSRGV